MGMTAAGGPDKTASEINITPLIDVLLVSLIIFMVVVPVTPHGLAALVPQPPRDDRPPTDPYDPIVVKYWVATMHLPMESTNSRSRCRLSSRSWPRFFAGRQEKVLFVQGSASVDYAKIAEVIDLSRQAGVDNIGLITPRLTAGR